MGVSGTPAPRRLLAEASGPLAHGLASSLVSGRLEPPQSSLYGGEGWPCRVGTLPGLRAALSGSVLLFPPGVPFAETWMWAEAKQGAGGGGGVVSLSLRSPQRPPRPRAESGLDETVSISLWQGK